MSQKIKYVIVPDVHSRDFWREPVKKALSDTDAKIVFLGDYVDPYPREFCDYSNDEDDKFIYDHIKSWEDLSNYTVKTLSDIIELKKEYPDRVILLLGNHDCGYLIGSHICSCRHERPNVSRVIEKLFDENRDLFQLAHEDIINDIHYIFSHAGINKKFAWDCFFEEANEDNVVTLFNQALKEDNYSILHYNLGLYSFWRGARSRTYGSLIWADAREWMQGEEDAYGFSVVGHTQLSSHRIDGNFAFLDAKYCVSLDEDGNFEKFE